MKSHDYPLDPAAVEQALKTYTGPRYGDFPTVGLYMDQVVELLNRYLAPLYFEQKPPYLTPSMVNNYVKNSIVRPPLKKRYKAYHLAYLYVVMVLKQCFTLQEIASLITIYTQIESSERIARDFDRFVQTFEDLLHNIMENKAGDSEYFKDPTWQQLLMVDVLRAAACRLYGTCAIYTFHASGENKND